MLYGKKVTKTSKTFLATYPLVGGLLRVELVRESDAWVAFFCTDPAATVVQILEAVAYRAAIKQDFHDLKEVHGARQQQVRHYWANIAVYHLNLWISVFGRSRTSNCAIAVKVRGTMPSVGHRMRTVVAPCAAVA